MVLPILLAACERSGTEPEPGAIEVLTIDTADHLVTATRVAWFDPTDPPFPLTNGVTDLDCATGACTLSGALPARVHVVASLAQPERTAPTEGGATCVYWDSTFTVVHTTDDEGQRVHLVLDPERRWCDDGISAGFAEAPPAPTVHADDVRYVPPAPPTRLEVAAADLAGDPLPLASANWYFPPKGPDYDGEHALACLDALCTRWGLPEGEEGPDAGQIYVNGTYVGPFHVWGDASYGDYQGALLVLPTSEAVALTFDPTIAGIE